MRYEFRTAEGRICCASDSADTLCPACQVAAAVREAQEVRRLRAARDFRDEVYTAFGASRLAVPEARSAVYTNPPRPYSIALAKREAQRVRSEAGGPR